VPSGDQVGEELIPFKVSWVAGGSPVAGITQMCGFPLRSDMNAIWVPSGDQAG
jgi:hypothetical protein